MPWICSPRIVVEVFFDTLPVDSVDIGDRLQSRAIGYATQLRCQYPVIAVLGLEG